MKTYFKVSFQYSECVYCTNIAHAETVEDVEAHYSKYTWSKVSEAKHYVIEEAKLKGMPIVEVEHIAEAQEPAEQPKESATDQEGENTMESYTITKNAQFNSIEINFTGKPSEAIREALKALRFRWHGVRRIWYGYTTEEAARAAIENAEKKQTKASTKTAKTEAKAAKVNRYGVQVGDIFESSWGYEQTNVDFFQVVALVGDSSVRVREVYPEIIEDNAVSSMSSDRVYKLTRDLLPAADRSIFINDQVNGDLKRLKSWAADGVSNPQFKLRDFADATLCTGKTVKTYESWYY